MFSKTLWSRLDRFRRALFLVEMAFRWLGYAQHSGALPSGFVGEGFRLYSFLFLRLKGKSVRVAPGALFDLPKQERRYWEYILPDKKFAKFLPNFVRNLSDRNGIIRT